jgi:hypothetical protein
VVFKREWLSAMLSLIAVPLSRSVSKTQKVRAAIAIPVPRRLCAASRLAKTKCIHASIISSRAILGDKMNVDVVAVAWMHLLLPG